MEGDQINSQLAKLWRGASLGGGGHKLITVSNPNGLEELNPLTFGEKEIASQCEAHNLEKEREREKLSASLRLICKIPGNIVMHSVCVISPDPDQKFQTHSRINYAPGIVNFLECV